MMVIDTSAVVAVLLGEKGAERLVLEMNKAYSLQMSAASVLETAIVLERRFGAQGGEMFDRWLKNVGVEIIAVTRSHVEAAREGFRRFGKGRHPAGLNFGDCFSYGLAKVSGGRLLFIGRDFSQTDISDLFS